MTLEIKLNPTLSHFGLNRLEKYPGLKNGTKHLIGNLLLRNGLLVVKSMHHSIHWIYIKMISPQRQQSFGKAKMVAVE